MKNKEKTEKSIILNWEVEYIGSKIKDNKNKITGRNSRKNKGNEIKKKEEKEV